MLLTATFLFASAQPSTTKDLNITTIFQHRDTKLLDLDGSPLAGKHAWDSIHEVKSYDDLVSCDICNKYCGYASIAMINSFYGGNISQDRLAYFRNTAPYMMGPFLKHPEQDLWHAGLGTASSSTNMLSWALNNASIYYYVGKPTLSEIKQWIDQNRPILTLVPGGTPGGHFVVTSGYDGQYIIIDEPSAGTKNKILYDSQTIGKVWVPPSNATGRSDEQSIWTDNNNGIMDFDDANRFYLNPSSNDADGGGILDKIEIRSYTFLGHGTFDSAHTRNPDVDKDGLRAERDPDTDNGGANDGQEDKNHNGKLDPGETDPFNATDDPYIPSPIAKFEYSPEKPSVNETITFDASESYSPKGIITSYEWDFRDNNKTTVTQPTINHTYAKPGKYSVTLKVTDNNTLSNTTTKQITITFKTDLNKDGTVNILDLTIVAIAYGAKPGDPNWNAIADLDKNGWINIIDLTMVAIDYGKTI